MTHNHPIRTLLIVGLLATCGGVFSARGSSAVPPGPATVCAASQLTAVGKLASASLACHAATATTLFPPNPCITAAMTAFERAWAAAEAKGGCITTVSETEAEAEVGGAVAAAVDELTGTPEDALLTTPAARACAARKLKATGKAARAQFACDTTGVKQGTLFSSACVNKAGGALVKAWGAAEAKGGCATQGDDEALNVNGLSVWGVTHLGPTPPPVSCGTFVTKWTIGGGPHGIAVDGSGNVFVVDFSSYQILKFDNTGTTLLTAWGGGGTGDGQFANPEGVAVDGSGNVFVADFFIARIQKFDNTGTFLTKWGSFGSGNGQFNHAIYVAVGPSGNVFVTDSGNNRLQKFDNTGTFLTTWGSLGSGNGQFYSPRGVAVGPAGKVFVADAGHNRIQKFDNTGTFLATWGSLGSGTGQFGADAPEGVAVDGSGNVFVTDPGNDRIQVFDNNGTFLTTWGTAGSGDGQLTGPLGIAVDGSGNVFVAEWGNARVSKFACPIPPPPPTECGVVGGDPAAGTATCGGPCPVDVPFCVWVPGTGSGTGACQCVNGDSPCGGSVTCAAGLCSIQSQTCVRPGGGACTCQ
jgi:sugar lactone lactonase YvrE